MEVRKNLSKKNRYDITDLLTIMDELRSPTGCKWDREQTHKSVRQNLIEECYELVEAIDEEDDELLKEELGDVLLQVVFHSAMSKEDGKFNFDDVVNDVAKKLVIRHPHVFSDTVVNSTDDILKNWDKIKKDTKGQKSNKEVLLSVSKALPSLMRHQKVLKKSKIFSNTDIKDLCLNFDIEPDLIDENTIGKLMSDLILISLSKGYDAEKLLGDYTDEFIEKTKD